MIFPRQPSAALSEWRGHRAIGVVYRPQYEQYGNYVPTSLPRRYDASCTSIRPPPSGHCSSRWPRNSRKNARDLPNGGVIRARDLPGNQVGESRRGRDIPAGELAGPNFSRRTRSWGRVKCAVISTTRRSRSGPRAGAHVRLVQVRDPCPGPAMRPLRLPGGWPRRRAGRQGLLLRHCAKHAGATGLATGPDRGKHHHDGGMAMSQSVK